MRAGKRERWVRYVNIGLGTAPDASIESQISLKAILERIESALRANERLQRKPRESARQHVRLVDLTFDQNKKYAVLLFRLIDKDAIDIAYEDFSDGQIEAHPKSRTQGNRVTAHLLVDLNGELKAGRRSYPAMLEETSGLSASRIQPLLDSLAARYGRGTYVDAAKKEHEFRCTVIVRPKVLGTIREELSEGVLKSFTLVHSIPPVQDNDESIFFREKKKRLELDVIGCGVTDKLDSVWEAVRKKARAENYELVKATYENQDGRTSTVDLQSKQADALEELVTKTRKISLASDSNYDKSGVCPDVLQAMKAEFESAK